MTQVLISSDCILSQAWKLVCPFCRTYVFFFGYLIRSRCAPGIFPWTGVSIVLSASAKVLYHLDCTPLSNRFTQETKLSRQAPRVRNAILHAQYVYQKLSFVVTLVVFCFGSTPNNLFK